MELRKRHDKNYICDLFNILLALCILGLIVFFFVKNYVDTLNEKVDEKIRRSSQSSEISIREETKMNNLIKEKKQQRSLIRTKNEKNDATYSSPNVKLDKFGNKSEFSQNSENVEKSESVNLILTRSILSNVIFDSISKSEHADINCDSSHLTEKNDIEMIKISSKEIKIFENFFTNLEAQHALEKQQNTNNIIDNFEFVEENFNYQNDIINHDNKSNLDINSSSRILINKDELKLEENPIENQNQIENNIEDDWNFVETFI